MKSHRRKKLKKDMAFNGFEQSKSDGIMYYRGLTEKSSKNTNDTDNFLDD